MAKILVGKVVSNKMQNTLVVSVERKFRFPRYQKVIIRHKKYKAHNELKDIMVNDYVSIRETRPLSREIRFVVVEKVAKTDAK